MSQAAVSDPTHSTADALTAFTFWVGDSLFAIDLDNVLSIEQDNSPIQPDPFQGRGSLGIIKHHGVPVRIFDFSEFMGISSSGRQKEELIKTLIAREQDHIDWLNTLEHSIKTGEPFAKARDPHECAFGQWYDKFRTRDEELVEILRKFDEPHKRIHALADRLLYLRDKGRLEQALSDLELERSTTLVQLRRIFKHARAQIRDAIKSVLLFVTTNGKEPQLALRLNEISDMVGFSTEQITPINALGITDDERLAGTLSGYLNIETGQDCLLVNVEGLLEAILSS